MAFGMKTMTPKFTLSEKTPGFPGGIPETVSLENPDQSLIPGVPDGTSVDIQPFGQEPSTAGAKLIEDGYKRIKDGEDPRSVIADMMAAGEAIIRNGKQPGNMDAFRESHPWNPGGAPTPPAAPVDAVSPPGEPPPDFMAGLMGNANTVMQGKKKLKQVAGLVAGARR